MNAFVQSIVQNRPVPVTGRDGRIAVALSMAAKKSWQENRPVRLEEIG